MTDRLVPEELSRLAILRRVPLEAVIGLLERCRVRKLQPGELLLGAGEANDTMYMVLSGALNVHLETPDTDPVATLVAGQTVGELSVIDDSPASATVVAREPTRLLVVDDGTFWDLIAASHEFSVNLLLLLAERMRASNDVLTANARLRRQLEREALVDGLTGLNNRRWLDQKLPRLARRCRTSGEALSLMVLDIDHFKRFNDTFGHSTGDQVLAGVAKAVLDCVRPTDMPARYGGEEIVIILPDTKLSGGLAAAERLRRKVEAQVAIGPDGQELPTVTVSIGIAELGPTEDHSALFARADAALYRAKHAGRNRVESSTGQEA